MSQNKIYLDHGASTPVRKEVVESMIPYWLEFYGNPSSIHQDGQNASHGLEKARLTIASLLNANPNEIIFTGSGSESDNLALRGVMWAARKRAIGNHLITSSIEHKAVLETARRLQDYDGFDVTIIPADEYGIVSIQDVESAIRKDTVLISIMAANNEIGSTQPIESIGRLAHDRGLLFHSDAIQLAAVNTWDLEALPIDLLSFSPHKFYGPKGVGILYARSSIELISMISGGSQENGRRAGTVNVPLAVGAAKSFQLAIDEQEINIAHYQKLRDRLIEGILDSMDDQCVLTGHPNYRLPYHASFAFKNINGNDLLIQLDMIGVSASSGSACLTGDPESSPVLSAIGLKSEWTMGGLRLTVGQQNTIDDIEYVIERLPAIIRKLRQLEDQFA
jgi:cysteine desulfurase